MNIQQTFNFGDCYKRSCDSEKFCPICEELLEETTQEDILYCIKCQKRFDRNEVKSDQSIEFIFGGN